MQINDNLVKLCLTRRIKNLDKERMPKFPMTCTKIPGKNLFMMEKQHEKAMRQKLIDFEEFKMMKKDIVTEVQLNIQKLLEKFIEKQNQEGLLGRGESAQQNQNKIKEAIRTKFSNDNLTQYINLQR